MSKKSIELSQGLRTGLRLQSKVIQGSFFENFWTVTDLAGHLKVSPATIYDWVHQRVIPYQKIRGRLLRFRPSEIEQWLSE